MRLQRSHTGYFRRFPLHISPSIASQRAVNMISETACPPDKAYFVFKIGLLFGLTRRAERLNDEGYGRN